MAVNPSDPCAEFADANGVLDIGKLIDTGYHVVACAIQQAEGATAAHLLAKVAHLEQALSHIQAARVISPSANIRVTPTKS